MGKKQNLITKMETWIKSQGWDKAEFALQLGISYQTVCRWMRGVTRPCMSDRKKIQEFSNGKITLKDWMYK